MTDRRLRTAQRLMAIARHPVISNSAHGLRVQLQILKATSESEIDAAAGPGDPRLARR